MAVSANTNTSALVALSSLRGNNLNLDRISKALQTGYRVADATDDGAIFMVAQGVRGDVKAYAAVQSSLSAAIGLGQVTMAAIDRIYGLVGDIKAKITSLADGSLTAQQQDIYRGDIRAFIGQINNFIAQADYNGRICWWAMRARRR